MSVCLKLVKEATRFPGAMLRRSYKVTFIVLANVYNETFTR